MKNKYQEIQKIVKKALTKADAGHDFNHVMRVYGLCLKLTKGVKNIDLDVLKIAALLHDIAGPKELQDKSGKTCHAELSAKMTPKILKKFGYSQDKIDRIVHCVLAHRYRTGVKAKTKEAKILFDADKLDALGAIGVARDYIWIGNNKAKIYDTISLKEYIKENIVGGKINGRIKDKTKHNSFFEFELKSKRIPGKLYTKEAKKIAKGRLSYMKLFFNRLKKEIKGEI